MNIPIVTLDCCPPEDQATSDIVLLRYNHIMRHIRYGNKINQPLFHSSPFEEHNPRITPITRGISCIADRFMLFPPPVFLQFTKQQWQIKYATRNRKNTNESPERN